MRTFTVAMLETVRCDICGLLEVRRGDGAYEDEARRKQYEDRKVVFEQVYGGEKNYDLCPACLEKYKEVVTKFFAKMKPVATADGREVVVP